MEVAEVRFTLERGEVRWPLAVRFQPESSPGAQSVPCQRLGGDGRGTASGWEGPGFHYLCSDPLSAVIVALPAWWFLAV